MEPASQYVSFYAPFWIKHQLFHELISSSLAAVARQEELSLDDFKHSLTMSDVPVSQVEFEITADHLDCNDTVSILRILYLGDAGIDEPSFITSLILSRVSQNNMHHTSLPSKSYLRLQSSHRQGGQNHLITEGACPAVGLSRRFRHMPVTITTKLSSHPRSTRLLNTSSLSSICGGLQWPRMTYSLFRAHHRSITVLTMPR